STPSPYNRLAFASLFFSTATAPTEIYTLSLHDALPIYFIRNAIEAERQGYDAIAITHFQDAGLAEAKSVVDIPVLGLGETTLFQDRKSTRLNSSHVSISYAVFCLKKKKNKNNSLHNTRH